MFFLSLSAFDFSLLMQINHRQNRNAGTKSYECIEQYIFLLFDTYQMRMYTAMVFNLKIDKALK